MYKKLLILLVLPILFSCSREEGGAPEFEVVEVEEIVAVPSQPVSELVAEATTRYDITHIMGDLYRARDNTHYTVFLVTPEGAILADPISLEFSEWLKTELAERFDTAVRYVLYSHHHWDHASGGAVFEDTAEFVGHENMIANLAAPFPVAFISVNASGEEVLFRSDARGGLGNNFPKLDANGNDELTIAEINANIRAPDITYSDTYTVKLGGKEVQMIHAGQSHFDDGSFLLFPEERVAFSADIVRVQRLPGGLEGNSIDDWVDSIGRMTALDFDTIYPAHGKAGTKADVEAFAQYFRDLEAAVDSAIADGLSLKEMQASITLDAYKDWERYDRELKRNIESAYDLAAGDGR